MTQTSAQLTACSLNQKLVGAIERQAELEDQVAQARQELRHAQQQIAKLEQEQRETKDRLAAGLLVSKSQVEDETQGLRQTLQVEQANRTTAEEARSRIEKELEDLTRSLFEEANKLVSTARKETAAVEERNAQLVRQNEEKTMLLASHQQQLEELKAVLQRMSTEEVRWSSRPGSPKPNPTRQQATRHSRELSLGKIQAQGSPLTPHFRVLPTYRTDTKAFYEFRALLPRQNTPKHSMERPTSDSTASPLPSPIIASSSYWGRSSTDDKKDKDLQSSKFWKRALIEDVEPTLRLDMAPDLGYLGRRTFLQAVAEGHLVVEAHPAHLARYQPERSPCALCGDNRNDAEHARRFRCRTSESKEAAVHPLCDWCLDRVRAVCGYVAFLRQVRDGLWKGEEEEGALMRCWCECVKLRETMFWTRVGHKIEY
ncbi:hypothetical protein BCR37DRAFT_352548 [Protomyces lactucae-debilis]|uniref:GDP/GTP exchange factor Sec2 N-terminal domain-containing protein n=1 Tax=Protomyces lactucae-debilis TaxID=2754530 RepID=A0A1Y2ESS3_PROLT|nr:uncharacterized protein BCR37DRAFT_352548 [Protomyces lactucae-debilis]ORY74629.1 hypothetical protein BCR37DRAFT_352548 [Protomyces lactucae-debilis]